MGSSHGGVKATAEGAHRLALAYSAGVKLIIEVYAFPTGPARGGCGGEDLGHCLPDRTPSSPPSVRGGGSTGWAWDRRGPCSLTASFTAHPCALAYCQIHCTPLRPRFPPHSVREGGSSGPGPEESLFPSAPFGPYTADHPPPPFAPTLPTPLPSPPSLTVHRAASSPR